LKRLGAAARNLSRPRRPIDHLAKDIQSLSVMLLLTLFTPLMSRVSLETTSRDRH
jgi:hypothetical protein